jgi:hypothetical protein
MKHQKLTLTLIAVLLPLSAVGVLLIKWQMPSTPQGGELFKAAFSAYQAKEFSKAGEIISAHRELLVAEPEGCELLISVYAELKELSVLEEISRQCMAQNRADGLAQEGLAFSLSSQGKIAEALSTLEAEHLKKAEVPRISIALARLLVMAGQDERAGDLFIEVIKAEESWSMWFAEALKQGALLKHANFVEKLGQVVLKQELVFAQLERTLQAAAEALDLATLTKALAVRQEKAAAAAHP